jgi:HEAT repeat protein
MRFPRPRPSVRMMIGLVAVAALLLWGWRTYLDPVRRWKVAIRDQESWEHRIEAIRYVLNGQVSGITSDQAIDECVELLGDKRLKPSIRETAAIALGAFKERARRAIPSLVVALRRDESRAVRAEAAFRIYQILGNHPGVDPIEREAVAGLVEALIDPDPRVRRSSACSLSWIGEGEVAIPTLIEALKVPDLDYLARRDLMTALLRSGPKASEALPVVLELAKDESIENVHLRGVNGDRRSAEALMFMGGFLQKFGQTDRALAILHRLAEDPDREIAENALKALDLMESAKSPAGSEASP